VARGCINRPGSTAESSFRIRSAETAHLYRTGDRVRYLSDGRLEFRPRGRPGQDSWIQDRAAQIEAALRHHPELEASVVVARED
jgi:non-ribosomal peptide synthetase component F